MSNRELTISLFYNCLKRYGLRTLSIYYKLKSNSNQPIKLKNIKHAIHIRKSTSDVSAFQQMFFSEEYDIVFDFEPKVIIDAGANIGLAAIYFANLYPEATIVSIEPENSNYKILSNNVAPYLNVISVRKALSNELETLEVVDENYGHWGYMTKKSDKPHYDPEKSTTIVTTTTISQLMKDHQLTQLDIVKVDIEGYEKELFESNYESWLPLTKCLIVEVHDRLKSGCSTSVFKAISKYDFSFSTKGENLIFRNNQL